MRIILPFLLILLTGCGSTGYSPTAYPFQIQTEVLQEKPLKKLVLATVNFSGEPTRGYLEKSAYRIDTLVEDYLKTNGYALAPSYVFENAWKQALRTYGEIYDPTTGRVDQRTWQLVMLATADALKEADPGIDAIVFTDLIEHDVQHSGGMKHYARWNGVTRKPDTQGPGTGVPVGFDWTQNIKGASLAVNIYNVDMQGLFRSYGGLDTLQAIDLKMSDPAFVRKKKILDKESHLMEGIRLAFHPFIPMKDYPGQAPAQ